MCNMLTQIGVTGCIDDLRKVTETCQVEFIHHPISYDDFFRRFLLPNKPCLLDVHATKDWRSLRDWVNGDGRPDFEYIDRAFGTAVVPVANCGRVQYDAQPKQDMTMADYIKYWTQHITADYKSDAGCLYLKDWHFTKVFPDYEAYTTPIFFSSDWLNEFWDRRKDASGDDYRFVYMGPKGSWTPFHADVFRSYSWSANVCGRKRWLLFPPGEEEHLKDTLGNLAYDLTSPDIDDPRKFPHRHRAREPFEVIQEAGQVIFVPSGWHHQVFNLEDTISINHNWLNGCNIDISWGFLQAELRSVQDSISDCREMDGWDQQCQLIMKASTGMDYAEFFNFLHIIASERLAHFVKKSAPESHTKKCGSDITCEAASGHAQRDCEETEQVLTNPEGGLSEHHFMFDLWRIQGILEDMLKNAEFLQIEDAKLSQKPLELMEEIKAVLQR